MTSGISRDELREMARVHPIAWAMYASEGKWLRARHLELLGKQLLRLVSGDITRLCVSMPPRHGKSELISKYFPTWFLGSNPDARVVLCSYGAKLTRQWSQAARDLFHRFGPEVFGADTWPRASWEDWPVMVGGRSTGGHLYAVGKGGALTGRGADLVICDDLVKDAMEANSPTLSQHTWEWFQSVPLTRLEPGGRCVVVMTRWAHHDVVGRLEEAQRSGDYEGEPWTFLNLPCLAENDDPLERETGQPLWPERWGADWAEKKREEVGSYVWTALYQGRPTPTEGAIFRAEWFKYYEPAEIRAEHMVRFATVDLAASVKETADYTVIASWAVNRQDGCVYLLDIVRDRYEGPDIIPALERARTKHDLSVIYVERIGFQLTLIQAARRANLPIRELRPDRDKVARALPATALLEAGRMLFPRGASWLPTLESELLQFPQGQHDDQVDAVAYAARLVQRVKKVSGGDSDIPLAYRERPTEAPRIWRKRRVYGRR